VGDAVSSILVLGSQATLVMTLGDVSEVYVLGEVDEADIGKVFLDQPARITVESFPDKKFEGKVTKISPMGVEEENVTTFEVRVSIDNPTGELKANMSSNAEKARRVADSRVGGHLRQRAQYHRGSPRPRRRRWPPQGGGQARYLQRHQD
jgi:multidrug efflux pump subunit AcrA (membrane-fusion protein)